MPVRESSRDPKDAAITIEDIRDFQCGYCARGANVMNEVLRIIPDK